jgi:hypothetical protein
LEKGWIFAEISLDIGESGGGGGVDFYGFAKTSLFS